MAYGLRNAKVPKDEIERRVQKAAGILELGGLLERKPRQLSGGQRQRVAMGRAIVRQPQVFLFDEPLSNLDAKLRAQTRLEIQKLHRELGITSLFVTHDQVEAMTLAQRMIVMNAGRIEQIGTPEQVYGVPATTFVASFIGSPPMNLLNGQATPAGFEVGGQLLPLPGAAPRQGSLTLGLRPEHTEPGAEGDPACWPLHVEVVEMLGAERLVHGHLAGAAFTLRIDATVRRCTCACRRSGCTGSTRPRASASRRPGESRALALAAVGRPPRRRQAGAREHARRVPAGCRARLPRVRM
jgi:sn-glycerol 3-phosphate transport system ATP-binding protein